MKNPVKNTLFSHVSHFFHPFSRAFHSHVSHVCEILDSERSEKGVK